MNSPDPTCNGEGVRIGGYGNREVSCEVCEGTGEAVPAGMKPWAGGEAAPADWDGGIVRVRRGNLSHVNGNAERWMHARDRYERESDIVAYTPRAALNPPTERVKAPSGTGEQPETVEGWKPLVYSSAVPKFEDNATTPYGYEIWIHTTSPIFATSDEAYAWAKAYIAASHPTPAGAAMPDDAVGRVADALANADTVPPDDSDEYWPHLARAAMASLATNAPEATDAAKPEGGA